MSWVFVRGRGRTDAGHGNVTPEADEPCGSSMNPGRLADAGSWKSMECLSPRASVSRAPLTP